MSVAESLLSPVIVGRDDLVALAQRRLDEVRAGHGQLLLVSGEAGIGKTRFLGAIEQLARERGFRVAKGEVAPQDRDVLAASLLDLGRSMRRDSAFGSMGRDLLEVADARLAATLPRRRDLVRELVDIIAGSAVPTVLVFEDLQWADDLSLETLTDLARQSRDRPLLLVGAYRSNEALHGSVLREWRSRLVTQRIAEEVRLARLSRDETAVMTTLILANGLPAPRDVVDAVYARTDGVPLHIEELCSALGRGRLGDSRAVLEAAVPETLQDATLARVGRLSSEAQAVARAGAVLGRSFVPAVLAGIMNVPVATLDGPVQELVDHDVLDEAVGSGNYDFHHQLLRDALYRSVPIGDRRRFHARAAEFGALLEGASQAHASMHYERAGMTDQAFTSAFAAAKQAQAMSSHLEAFDLFRRAAENMPATLPQADRIRVLLRYAEAAYNVDRTRLAADLGVRARELAIQAGEPLLAAQALHAITLVGRRDGESLTVRRHQVEGLLNELEAIPASTERNQVMALALDELALVEMAACRFGNARAIVLEGIDLARRTPGADTTWLEHYLPILDIIDGRVADGMAELRAYGAAIRDRGIEDNGVGCYRDVALLAMRALDYREAEVGLAEGMRYAESVEQTFCGHWLQSCQAVVSWAAGRWDDAVRQGGQAASDYGSGGSRALAQLALGYVAASRGQRDEAEAHLAPALAFAHGGELVDAELQAQWGFAEAALHAGDPETAATISDAALAMARAAGEWMFIAPFAVTGVRAHQAAGRPEEAGRYLDQFLRAIGPGAEIARPATLHATGLVRLAEGSTVAARVALESAVDLWDARGRRWEALWARLDLAGALLRSNRYGDAVALIREVERIATEIGSEPLLARAGHLARVARGRGEELEPWHPLTTREFEVARKIADGLTNAELADQLGISPRTASSHVEHILAKLGVSRRAEIAAWAMGIMAAQPGSSGALAGRTVASLPR